MSLSCLCSSTCFLSGLISLRSKWPTWNTIVRLSSGLPPLPFWNRICQAQYRRANDSGSTWDLVWAVYTWPADPGGGGTDAQAKFSHYIDCSDSLVVNKSTEAWLQPAWLAIAIGKIFEAHRKINVFQFQKHVIVAMKMVFNLVTQTHTRIFKNASFGNLDFKTFPPRPLWGDPVKQLLQGGPEKQFATASTIRQATWQYFWMHTRSADNVNVDTEMYITAVQNQPTKCIAPWQN